ncbi:hypothetical protein [Helicobacter fennelliae]
MAISQIGNITYINQNMQTTSAQHANAMQRGDFIPDEFEDKLKEIEEVRPTEQNQAINKDSKSKQEFTQQEQKNKSKSAQNDDETQEDSDVLRNRYILNIKI